MAKVTPAPQSPQRRLALTGRRAARRASLAGAGRRITPTAARYSSPSVLVARRASRAAPHFRGLTGLIRRPAPARPTLITLVIRVGCASSVVTARPVQRRISAKKKCWAWPTGPPTFP